MLNGCREFEMLTSFWEWKSCSSFVSLAMFTCCDWQNSTENQSISKLAINLRRLEGNSPSTSQIFDQRHRFNSSINSFRPLVAHWKVEGRKEEKTDFESFAKDFLNLLFSLYIKIHSDKMSIRAKFLGFVDVIMRIPPLFLLDEILKMSLFESSSSHFNLVAELNETINSNLTANVTDAVGTSLDIYGLSVTLFKCVVFLIGK